MAKTIERVSARRVGNGFIVNVSSVETIKPKTDTEIPNKLFEDKEEIFLDKNKMSEFLAKNAKKL